MSFDKILDYNQDLWDIKTDAAKIVVDTVAGLPWEVRLNYKEYNATEEVAASQ